VCSTLSRQRDTALLRHVLVNVIGNAFKFSAIPGRPKSDRRRAERMEVAYYVRTTRGFDMEYAGKLSRVPTAASSR